jgi:hypothetical protein
MRRFLLVLIVTLACAGPASAYPWPIKPFDRQHPIRGFFGDPRTVYENQLDAGAFDGPGTISFHQGVDISAPNGTPVYPVENGTIHYLGAQTFNLVTKHDVVFQYFHVTGVAGEGEHVVAKKTLLGFVAPPYGHVHLTEIDNTLTGMHAVNPLQRGHLSPYADHTRPDVHGVLVRNAAGDVETTSGLCGRVELDVDAFDTQPMLVPGVFAGLPVAPAFVAWKLTRWDGKVVRPWKTVADFRQTLPPNRKFFSVYAKGTYENSPRFGRKQYTGMPGRYLFLLSGSFNTSALPNGTYTLSIKVADVRGNSRIVSTPLGISNAPGGVCADSLGTSTTPPPQQPGSGNGD